jgi:hypothetical protein
MAIQGQGPVSQEAEKKLGQELIWAGEEKETKNSALAKSIAPVTSKRLLLPLTIPQITSEKICQWSTMSTVLPYFIGIS